MDTKDTPAQVEVDAKSAEKSITNQYVTKVTLIEKSLRKDLEMQSQQQRRQAAQF